MRMVSILDYLCTLDLAWCGIQFKSYAVVDRHEERFLHNLRHSVDIYGRYRSIGKRKEPKIE